MLHFIQVLDHASVIEPICPETSEQESEEVKKSESTHQLCQKVQDVEAADVDRLLEGVLPEIHRYRKVGIKAIQGWSVIILDVTYFIACSDARRFSLISEQAQEGVAEDKVKILIYGDYFTDVDRNGLTNSRQLGLHPVDISMVIMLAIA